MRAADDSAHLHGGGLGPRKILWFRAMLPGFLARNTLVAFAQEKGGPVAPALNIGATAGTPYTLPGTPLWR